MMLQVDVVDVDDGSSSTTICEKPNIQVNFDLMTVKTDSTILQFVCKL
jgi:hypothetical protein